MAEKSITDRLTRVLVIAGACAGLCYNALWYFPLLMALGGIATVLWDCWARQQVGKLRARLKRRKTDSNPERTAEESDVGDKSIRLEDRPQENAAVQRRTNASTSNDSPAAAMTPHSPSAESDVAKGQGEEVTPGTDMVSHAIPVRVGISIIVVFFGKKSRSV